MLVHNNRAQTKKNSFSSSIAVYPGERSTRLCPTHKRLPQSKELRVQLDRRKQAFWAVSGERISARHRRGYGPSPSRTAACDTNTDSKLEQTASLPFGKQNSVAQFFDAAVKWHLCPWKDSLLSCSSHKAYHKGMCFECSQTDRRRQYLAVPRARSTARQTCTRAENEVAKQSVRAVSSILNIMRNP